MLLKYILLLPFIIVWLPFYAVYKIIQALYRRHQKKKRDIEIAALIPGVRKDLRKDRLILVTAIVDGIRQHWHTLEDKLELHTIEDDYGNLHVSKKIEREFVYFSEKVLLPTLQHHIDAGETTNKNAAIILHDTVSALGRVSDGFDIKPEDSSKMVASKFLSLIDEAAGTTDDTLYDLYSNPSAMAIYETKMHNAYFSDVTLTLNISPTAGLNESIIVNPFVCLVMTLYFSLHNIHKNSNKLQKLPIASIFEGNDPYKYEEFIKTELRNAGYSAKRTRGSGDYGGDVIASKNGKSFAIQCKLYNHTVGTKAVQEIVSGRIYYKTDFAVVVSDNKFTEAAKVLARKSDVVLTHHKDLLRKLDALAPNDDNTPHRPVDNQMQEVRRQPASPKQMSQDDIDKLVTVILPTIRND